MFTQKKRKKIRVIDTLSPNFELLIFSIQTQGINFIDVPFYQMQSFTKHVALLLMWSCVITKLQIRFVNVNGEFS